jgi:hypothetical protein
MAGPGRDPGHDVVGESSVETGTILPRVEQLLTRIASTEERQTYERFFRAASVAIERLGELDIAGPSNEDPDSADPTFWEKLAPEVTGTLMRVEAFLDIVRHQFPITEVENETALDAAFDDAFSFDRAAVQPTTTNEPADIIQEAAKTLQSFCSNLTHDLHDLKKALATPALMQDRWNLLERLGAFRGRSRSGIGEMVFVAARLFAVVRKEDVVPFYKEDVVGSRALRRSVSAMRNRIDVQRARLELVKDKDDGRAVGASVARIMGEFDGFTQTDVYRSMRASDKRTFLGVRHNLRQLSQQGDFKPREVEQSVEGLTRFLDSLALMNQRELLLMHDRETIAQIVRALGATLDAVGHDDAGLARQHLRRALAISEGLMGREPTFDVLLELFRRTDLDHVELPELLAMAQLIRRQL